MKLDPKPLPEDEKRARGRPKKHRFAEVYAELEDPPSDPYELQLWMLRVLGKAAKEVALERGNREIVTQLRGIIREMRASIPDLQRWMADKAIREDALPAKPKARKGPAMHPRPRRPGALRRDRE